MQCEELFKKIDGLEQEYIQFWADVCSIESPTKFKEGVDAVGRYFIDKAKPFGWEIEVRHEDVSGDAVCITMNPDAPGKAVCISGHMDTVHPVGSFGTPPVRIEDGWIYGPGVKDCKGGAVAGFYAMAALAAVGFTARPVKLILQSDEENTSATSGRDTVRFMAEKAKDCLVFLNTEGYQREKVCVKRKGIMKCRFDITGKAMHGSKCFEGISAIREAAYKIVELEKLKDKEGVTCNVGTIEGGTATNVVPETCSFTVDFRFATAPQLQEVEKTVERVAAKSYVEGSVCKATRLSLRPALDPNEANLEMFRRFNEVCTANGLPEMITRQNTGGSDAADMSVAGITALDSLGVVGENTHSIRERAELCSLKESAKRLACAAYCL